MDERSDFRSLSEIDKLKRMLRIPITSVEFDDRYEFDQRYLDENGDFLMFYAKIYINDTMVGTAPYMLGGFGPMYYSGEREDLNWVLIFDLYRNNIMEKVRQKQPLAASAVVRDYKSLYLKDEAGEVINLAFCDYEDDEWRVIVSGTNVVTKVKVTRVVLFPPSPIPPVPPE